MLIKKAKSRMVSFLWIVPCHYGRVHCNGNNQEIYKKIRCGIAEDCGMHGTHRRRIFQESFYVSNG
jgi:hypothetical protein